MTDPSDFPELRLLIERLDGKMDRLADQVGNLSTNLGKYETRISAMETQHKIDWNDMRERYHELAQVVQTHMPFEKQIGALESDVEKLKEDLVERRGSNRTLVAVATVVGAAIGTIATILVRVLT